MQKNKYLLLIHHFLIILLSCFASIGLQAQPANDNCANATVLTIQANTCTTQTVGTNVAATNDNLGDCTTDNGDTAGDVWFTFTTTEDLIYVIETTDAGGITDPVMEVFTGNDCSNLTAVDCDDNGGPAAFTKFITQAGASTTFFIRVWESGNNDFGDFNICVRSHPLPTNDACANATALTVQEGSCTSQTFGTNIGVTNDGLGIARLEVVAPQEMFGLLLLLQLRLFIP